MPSVSVKFPEEQTAIFGHGQQDIHIHQLNQYQLKLGNNC